jgi:arylsulfatase
MWPVEYDGTPSTTGAKATYPPLPLIEDNEVAERITDQAGQDKLTRVFTERSVDFINRNADDPFFLYLAHSMVHVPLGADEAFRGRSEAGLFGDVMEELD